MPPSCATLQKDTAGRAFKELQEKGFLVLTTPGSFSRKVRHATEWRLTAQFHEKEGTTKEFMRWKPQERSLNGYGEWIYPDNTTAYIKRN